ncbi:MAG: hypothetical protein Q9186_003774 [Xanthomendoza sp. 1 TL-2023]
MEVGVLTAFKQYRRAKHLEIQLSRLESDAAGKSTGSSEVRTVDGSSQLSTTSGEPKEIDVKHSNPSTRPFSHTYGFYILMGGLAVNVSSMHDQLDRVLITPSGLVHLAEKGYSFHVSDKDIKDKSKASALAKGRVLLQITWTVFQCLSRKVVGLPLSVLEVHVLVHAGCALIMYILWFNKPVDVDETVDVSSKIPEKIVALMLVRNHRFGAPPYGNFEIPIEYSPVKLSGPRSGIWPDLMISEAAYLMYNPHPIVQGPNSNAASNTAQEPTSTLDITMHNTPAQGEPLFSHSRPDENDQNRKARHGSITIHLPDRGPQPPLAVSGVSSPPKSRGVQQRSQGSKKRGHHPGHGKMEFMTAPPRRGAVYASTRRTPSNPSTENDHICLGYKSDTIPGVIVVATVSTGQFLQNSVGPNAFVAGEWRGDRVSRRRNPPFRPPTSIVQVPDDLRKRLPLGHVDSTTIQYHSPLTISLSARDVRRWELAGTALGDELASHVEQPPLDGSFMKIHNEAGATESFNHSVWGAPVNTNRHIAVLQRLFIDVFSNSRSSTWGPTTRGPDVTGIAVRRFGILRSGFIHFPTYAEKLLWRLSAVTLISVPVVAALLLYVRVGLSASWAREGGSVAFDCDDEGRP